ncbi:MAG: N-acetylneuraminate synthase [Saprospiraceae bacterium]|nr:N-acetylneuraminate synthase [Saprospiraceae bacterium]
MTRPRTLIIAEAGVNHNGNIDLAKQLIEVAAEAGADYVKFQTFNASKLVSASAPTASYQQKATGDSITSQQTLLKRLQLSIADHKVLIDYCRDCNISFLSTAFDHASIDLLASLGQQLFKIPSGEITNLPYLKYVARQHKPMILSTGMSTLGEVEQALNVLLEVYPERESITILHCNTEYPTPFTDVNLNAMQTMAQAFLVNVGYSDHTLGIEVPVAAVALGAFCIEKHFTLNRSLPGPDQHASLEPHELKAMIQAIRNVEMALGSSIKQPSPSELKNRTVARKSIHLSRPVPAAYVLTRDDLIMKRPGDGISPFAIEDVIGKSTNASFPEDHKLSWQDLIP